MQLFAFLPPSTGSHIIERLNIWSADDADRVARELGRLWVSPQSRRSWTMPLERQVRDDRKKLLDHYQKLAALIDDEVELPPAADWILDNYVLVEETLNSLRRSLSSRHARSLPRLVTANGTWPRAYALAQAFLQIHDYAFAVERLSAFVHAFQTTSTLLLAELWALPDMIRAVLAHCASRIAADILADRLAHAQADKDADAFLADWKNGEGTSKSPEIRAPKSALPYLAQLLQRLRDEGVDHDRIMALLHTHDPSVEKLDDLIHAELVRKSRQSHEMRNAIISLRQVAAADWVEFCESVNEVDRILRAGSDFAALDLPTRNIYRGRIERIAARAGRMESHIAAEIVALAKIAETQSSGSRNAHVGYYLIAEGYAQLRERLGLSRSLRSFFDESEVKPRFVIYALFNITLIILLISGVLRLAFRNGLGDGIAFAMSGLFLLPAWEAATALINNFSSRLFPVTPLPSLALRDGIPDALRTAVVIPVLIGSAEDARDYAQQLEVHYLSNKDDNLSFFLLTDFKDAGTASVAGDDAILDAARQAIAAVNQRYPRAQGGGSRFFLLHRQRKWNAGEGRWMGWERKRGKLHEFNRLLRGATDTSYLPPFPDASWPSSIRYVVTLDADTRLPHNAVRRLIGKMAHPLNHAMLDSARRVVQGYGILQPRVASALPSDNSETLLQRIFYRASGIDPYAFAASDLYQDLFAEGSFTGKGIYDIDIFETALDGRLPENAILSHDLIEGAFARAGLASDIEVVEEYPRRYDVVCQRQHRWVRGDWQLLPWILGRSSREVNSISYWKMVDNLRRSLTPIMAFIVLAASWLCEARAAVWLTALVIILTSMPLIIPFGFALIPRRGMSRRAYAHQFVEDLVLLAKQITFHTAFLPHQAWLMADAILRTLWRLAVTHRHMLEWVTASESMRRSRGGLPAFYRSMGGGVVLALAVLVLVGVVHPLGLGFAMPFVCLWLVAPAFAYTASQPVPVVEQANLDKRQQAALHDIARETWRYFEIWAGEQDNGLPPDNFQEDPEPVVAHRTSPTNIGLYLLSTVAAQDFGWITRDDMLTRIEKCFASLDRLKRYRGHFLNWYDTATLKALEPFYVSTVDSGNLAGYLLVLESALRAIGNPRAINLAMRARGYFEAMDFSFLYNRARRLMAIGFRLSDESLDESCYDMLASEARLGILLAIAKNDVPAQSWFHLSRSATAIGITPALISWAGSMFEYLMPSLLLREPASSLLGQTLRLVVMRQRDYAGPRVKAWGISESAYNARDWEMNYQYSAFGVPGLGIKRGLSENMVLAPYATGLAAMVDPVAALENYEALTALGGKGSYGWYEAIDFTPARLPSGTDHIPVRAYMAHHQGMTILAIHNILKNGLMRDRFHSQPLVQSVELLLQEAPPRYVAVTTPRVDEVRKLSRRPVVSVKPRIINTTSRAVPAVQILGNGSYNCLITSSGSGYSVSGKASVTRNALENRASDLGSYIYVRDVNGGNFWSAAYLPAMVEPDYYAATFSEHSAEFHRRDGNIDTGMRVVALSNDHGEARHITLVNKGRHPRRFQLVSYMEMVLGDAAADAAHPAFSKIFVTTRYDAALNTLIAMRCPRNHNEIPLWAAHFITGETGGVTPDGFETDRARFIGRGRNLRQPAAMQSLYAGNSQGTVLDPVFSLRASLDVKPGSMAELVFWTLVAESEAALLALVKKYKHGGAFREIQDAAWLYSQLYFQHFRISAAETRLFQAIAARLVFNDPAARAPARAIIHGAKPQRALWPASISGDRPILLLRVNGGVDRKAPALLIKAHAYLAMKGLAFDLVIMHESNSSYLDPVYQEIEMMVRSRTSPRGAAASLSGGGVYLLRQDQTNRAVYDLVLAAARLVLTTHRGSIGQQIFMLEKAAILPAEIAPMTTPEGDAREITLAGSEFFNGYGGFVEDGRAYRIVQGPETVVPAPWVNILANPWFGCVVAENGAGMTWFGNSRENKLTPWTNDPVINPGGEALYVRDEESGKLWSPTSSPIRVSKAIYIAQHGIGESIFETSIEGIASQMTVFVPPQARHKIMILRLRNTTAKTRRLSLTGYVDLLLGVNARLKGPIVVTDMFADKPGFFAENRWQEQSRPEIVFYNIAAPVHSFTCDRATFLGANGDIASPDALCNSENLAGKIGAGMDACFAVQTRLRLAPGESLSIPVIFGVAESREEASAHAAQLTPARAEEALQATRSFWRGQTSRIAVSTPDRAMDIMLNGWLLYQTVVCRIWARSGFYQSSGAYGYRDQLQDVMAGLYADPAYAREHILRAASRQFPEGDVQHWWLPSDSGPGPGIRTLFSDDPVWLPFVVAHYVAFTGDTDILDVETPFLEGPALDGSHAEAFFMPAVSERCVTLAEHCRLALERGLRTGSHKLCLMGGGDWNDGMNRIGEKGEGESIWLSWFVIRTIDDYLKVAGDKVPFDVAESWRRRAAALAQAAEESAWDGQWYRRAFFDDGTPVGASAGEECRIDSLAQSWAVISGAADPSRTDTAMRSADSLLNDYENRVAKLFTPPFERMAKDPGYIKAYPPGLRENGGQYTHAALWMVMAMARLGWNDKAHDLFAMLNPIMHSLNMRDAERYKTEPYVVVADVYDNPQHRGRGGWSWYTGSAGWMYRVGIEEILGLKISGARLTLIPHIPDSWPGFDLTYRYGSANYILHVRRNAAENGPITFEQALDCGADLALVDDGKTHHIKFTLKNP